MVTAILTVYKRDTLDLQLEHLKNQSVPVQIWLDVTRSDFDLSKYKDYPTNLHLNQNLKYHGRFYYALNADTEYVFIVDDDIFPGNLYMQNCIDTLKRENAVVCGYGVTLDKSGYKKTAIHGWRKPQNKIVHVDMGGHSWFMRRDTLKYIAFEQPLTYDTGEDLHFSYVCQKYGNLKTVVAPHSSDKQTWSSDPTLGMKHGTDANSSYKQKDFVSKRGEIVKHQIQKGWKLKCM